MISSAPWTTALDGVWPSEIVDVLAGLLLVLGDHRGRRLEVLLHDSAVVVEVALLAGREHPVGGVGEPVAGGSLSSSRSMAIDIAQRTRWSWIGPGLSRSNIT